MCTSFFYFFCVSSLLGISIFANLNRIPDLLRLKNVESVQAVVISSFARSDGNSVATSQLAIALFSDKTDVCNDVCELLRAVQCCAMRWGHKCKDCSRPCWSSDQHCWQQPCLSHQCSLRALSCFEVACCVKILSNIDSISRIIKICSLWNKVGCYMLHPKIL